jgi:biotin operon repressor
MAEENNQLKKSFWAFIPSIALEDRTLSSTAKLILAEIYALADQNGVCYPTNKHFSQLLGISETQVSRCINQLKKGGWIQIEILKEEGNLRVLKINLRGISEKLKRSYQKVKEGYYQKVKERNSYIETHLENISSYEGVRKNTTNEVSIIRNYFIQKCQELKGFKPEMSFAKEGKLIKEKLKRYSVEQLKDLIDKFLNSEIGDRLGWTLSVCLSAPIINQWLAGKLEKKKRPYWNGFPLRKVFGKWQVLVDGEWKEFAGNEKEIVFK